MKKQLRIAFLFMFATCPLLAAFSACYSYEFGSKDNPYPFADNKTVDTQILNGLAWTLRTDGPRSTSLATGGMHYGTSKSSISYLQLSTSGIGGKIVAVDVEAWCATDAPGQLKVSVGGSGFMCKGKEVVGLTSDQKTYRFEGAGSGELVIRQFYAQSMQKALYLHHVTIEYNDGTTVLFDENADNAAVINGKTGQGIQNVSLNRTLSAGYWNTFCVPFDVSAGQMAKIFGEVELRAFTGKVENGGMLFAKADAMQAGVPYLLKPQVTVENPLFEDVRIEDASPQAVSDASGAYAFVGIFSPYTLKTDGTELFLGNHDCLYKPQPDHDTMAGFRALFRIQASSALARARVVMSEGTATVVEKVEAPDNRSDRQHVYTISGQAVQLPVSSLPKGIYIIHGKKVIIK